MLEMKKTAVNIMATTGSALILLAFFVVIFGDTFIYARTFFEIFGANIVIHLGLLLTRKFESRYVFLEFLLDVSYIIVVLVVFGFIFNWYTSVPVWILVIMAVVIYIFGLVVDIARSRKDAKEMDELLQKGRKKHINTAS
jgi:hypothetical protein